ncbi:antitoxin VbhA family protein [Herbaspirillum sp. GW103]|uniref:antitoxin VbhA family protein n=1 Tax=Herbaspirillum sp. GW103 TaxID=1175306 RepID=UPI0012F69162|nr:antitoxin VbhA family protein [Herbaspirillum sp. GW103]
MHPLNNFELGNMKRAFAQTDAIFALEGFEPDADMHAIREALLAGRVTHAQVIQEKLDFIKCTKLSMDSNSLALGSKVVSWPTPTPIPMESIGTNLALLMPPG